jgi:ATP-dependent RNA helicase DDX46/PRP5
MGRIMQGEDSDSDYDEAEEDGAGLEDENDEEFLKRVKKTRRQRLTSWLLWTIPRLTTSRSGRTSTLR